MSLFLEYDKVTRQIRRVLTENDLPPDAAHLSYVEVPVNGPEIDLSLDVDVALDAINDYVGTSPDIPSSEETIPSISPTVREIR